MKKTVYTLSRVRFGRSLCFAVVSDLHGEDPTEALAVLRQEKPNYILMPGDISEHLDGSRDSGYQNALRLLREAANVAPTFYSPGNHEDGACRSWSKRWKSCVRQRNYHASDLSDIAKTGVVWLQNQFVVRDGLAFGGLSSGLICDGRRPEMSWLSDFFSLSEPKILLCHHPEYYEPYLRAFAPDLLVSGHAHGGQWRIFGRGVFAPGQGLFPKYTSGVHDDCFVIGTGLKKSGIIPRLWNEPEVVLIRAE